MTGEQLKSLQKQYGWNNKQLATILNDALGRKYDSSRVSVWRNDRGEIPTDVEAFLAALDDPSTEPVSPQSGEDVPFTPAEDTPPRQPDTPTKPTPGVSVLSVGGSYSKICTEFFELIATAVGMIGAATGNDALRRDGQIIDQDKRELGAAWGKLAETNETFRNMILATDKQGAYLAVALATGTTVGRIYRNHTDPALQPVEMYVVTDDGIQPAPAA